MIIDKCFQKMIGYDDGDIPYTYPITLLSVYLHGVPMENIILHMNPNPLTPNPCVYSR